MKKAEFTSRICASIVGIVLPVCLLILMRPASKAAFAATKSSYLEQARQLVPPQVVATANGETEGIDFWATHRHVIRGAWREWEQEADEHSLVWPTLQSVLDQTLYKILERVWTSGDVVAGEQQLQRNKHWVQVAPDVYSGQLLDPSQIHQIRDCLDAAESSQIPRRRPNGMNRYGLVLHPDDVDGAVVLKGWETFYEELLDRVVRPISRMLFPYHVRPNEDDIESYAFTIRYEKAKDTELKEHADASVVTLNVNLNRPGEIPVEGDDDGIFFRDPETHEYHNVTLRPGQALIHRGIIRHGAHPNGGSGRMQLVVWFMGAYGYVRIVPYDTPSTVWERWNLENIQKNQKSEPEL